MASWLDVRARGGRWLVRIEDLDGPRTVAGAAEDQLDTLAAYGFRWDGPVVRQSDRDDLYREAFEQLRERGLVYPCGCTRREVEDAASAPTRASPRYPGTCRDGLPAGRSARAWRFRVPDGEVIFEDRAAGVVHQDVAKEAGDFVIRRADGLWAYQLAVVVDDARQHVTDVVRGADLLDSTPRQRLLQEALGLPSPRTLHVPLVVDADGAKLAKGHGAAPLPIDAPLPALTAAARHLWLEPGAARDIEDFWERATRAWGSRWPGERAGRVVNPSSSRPGEPRPGVAA
jgi:glutamyl-Q tRNA(Asp) synthetase